MFEGNKVALVVGAVVGTLGIYALLAFLVVSLILGAFFLTQLDDVFEEEFSPEAISVGESFHWNDSDYTRGWELSPVAGGRLRPTGLTLVSEDDAVESPPETYVIAFVRDDVIFTQATCETEDSIAPGTANTLPCGPSEDAVGDYDELVIGYPEDLTIGDPWDSFRGSD